MPDATFRVATFNANSIRTRLDQVVTWLSRERPHVLALQETKVQDEAFPALAFQEAGYQVVFRGQKAYSGVALAARLPISDVAYGFQDGAPDADEVRLLWVSVAGVTILNTYVPQGRDIDSPHFPHKLAWLARLGNSLSAQISAGAPLLWMGDLNVAPHEIDVHDPKGLHNHVDFHPDARAALEAVRARGFVDIVRKHHPDEAGLYTYWDYRVPRSLDRNLGWRIDHIWATDTLARRSLGAWVDIDARRVERPSDHTFVVAEFAW